MSTQSFTIIQRVWNYCNVLRDDGISYGYYLERRLSVAREVASVVEKALVRAARLRQAVLRSVFEGKLSSGKISPQQL